MSSDLSPGSRQGLFQAIQGDQKSCLDFHIPGKETPQISLNTCFIPFCYGVRRSLLNPKTPEPEHPLAIISDNLCFTDEETEPGTTELNSSQVRTRS